MTSRFRLVLIVGSLSMTLAGCGDAFNAGPIVYRDSELFQTKVKDAPDLQGKPNLQDAVRKALADLFGPNPQNIKVPSGSGLPEGGRRLANLVDDDGKIRSIEYVSAQTGAKVPVAGGYGLYRRYCLHCHGVQGAGNGPTAEFLYPIPRDYRRGVFKFTSTSPSNPKPTRDDLRKTLLHGLHGTSMPAFEALMDRAEIEQVIDYVIFLSIRGETERNLIAEAALADKDDPSGLSAETVKEIVDNVVNNWKAVEGLVVAPKARRTESTRESVLRGRNIFLGINTTGNKVACTDCHGAHGLGNGTSFVEKPVFDKVVFGRKSIDEAIKIRYRELEDEHASSEIPIGEGHGHSGRDTLPEPFDAYKSRELINWEKGSKDDWGNPLRPANLNLGVYKGGRRPIDLYWRIAKGINGAKMPAHASLLPDDQIWDVVNFILTLPYEPELLKDADTLKKNAAKPTAVTQR